MVQKLAPDPFIKNENRACFWINSRKFNIAFIVRASRSLPKYTKLR